MSSETPWSWNRRSQGSDSTRVAAWALAFLGLAALLYLKLPGTLRHFGFFWVALVAVTWIAVADGAVSTTHTSRRLHHVCYRSWSRSK